MPELPEVETVKRGLAPALEGRRIRRAELRRADLRFPFPARFAERLTGRQIETLSRRAKYILIHLDQGEVLLVHLGMTGRFTLKHPDGAVSAPGEFYHGEGGAAEDGPHDHVRLTLDDGTQVTYSDPRRFGLMDLVPLSGLEAHKLLRHTGIEPLGNELSADFLKAGFKGRRTPVKAALLDQTLIAGLGNIYVCEALHRAGISPRRLAGKVPAASLARLAPVIREILEEAIRAGGSTLRDYARADGSAGAFQQEFRVYDREGQPCRARGCGGTVKRIVQAGRSTFYCPRCQR